jgi:hypothetical protein
MNPQNTPIRFLLFRYQADLVKEIWWPLGVVAERKRNDETQIAVVCLQRPIGEIADKAVSVLAKSMLEDVPTILRQEIERCGKRFALGQDFLEELRSQNPWNFHFSVPRTEQLDANDVLVAALRLFEKHVIEPQQREKSLLRPNMAIRPQKMELFAVEV